MNNTNQATATLSGRYCFKLNGTIDANSVIITTFPNTSFMYLKTGNLINLYTIHNLINKHKIHIISEIINTTKGDAPYNRKM